MYNQWGHASGSCEPSCSHRCWQAAATQARWLRSRRPTTPPLTAPLPSRPPPACPPAAVNYRLHNDHLIKLSISHALAQSAKLSVYEERVIEIVESTKDLPETLAATGEVGLSRKQIACLIGRVFIQKSAVNLLSTVLDTPEFFWSAPDSMQNLYKRVCEVGGLVGAGRVVGGGAAPHTAHAACCPAAACSACSATPAPCSSHHLPSNQSCFVYCPLYCLPLLQYMEYDTRVEVLNNRFQVLQEMLDM